MKSMLPTLRLLIHLKVLKLVAKIVCFSGYYEPVREFRSVIRYSATGAVAWYRAGWAVVTYGKLQDRIRQKTVPSNKLDIADVI